MGIIYYFYDQSCIVYIAYASSLENHFMLISSRLGSNFKACVGWGSEYFLQWHYFSHILLWFIAEKQNSKYEDLFSTSGHKIKLLIFWKKKNLLSTVEQRIHYMFHLQKLNRRIKKFGALWCSLSKNKHLIEIIIKIEA